MIRPARPDDAPAIARVHVRAWQETYAGLLPPEAIAARTEGDRLALWTRVLRAPIAGGAILAAERDGAVAGFGQSGPQRTQALRDMGHTGEVWCLYLLASAQRTGLGRALMGALLDALAGDGHRSAAVWVLRDNPAAGFYARLGGVPVLEGADAPGGAPEVAFAYDLRPRATPCRPPPTSRRDPSPRRPRPGSR